MRLLPPYGKISAAKPDRRPNLASVNPSPRMHDDLCVHFIVLDSEAHKLWVRELATRLRASGVDITLDQWHLAPGDQLPQFMESAVRDSGFVLVVE